MIKKAFTLAEVLITLGIIGILSVIITINLINKTNNKQNITAWRVLYSQISNSFNYTVENEAVCASDDTTYWQFVNEFLKNFEIIDECFGTSFNNPLFSKNNDVICSRNKKNKWQGITNSDVGTGYKTLAGGNFNAYNINNKSVLLKNGAVLYFGRSHGGPWLAVDVNSYNKGPNVIGKDFFVIKMYEKKILPLGAVGTYNSNTNGEICECSKNKGTESGNYFIQVGNPGSGTVVSGGCCSAYYLHNK